MTKRKNIVIVGAGPSGLAMGIFLDKLGYTPTILDKKSNISDYSKALGVNPRTLEILNPFGLTDKFLANGRKMVAVNLWKADKHIYRNDFAKAKTPFPFMLIQPQKESEELLLEEVRKRNIDVAYDTEFEEWSKADSQYTVSIKGKMPLEGIDYIIGADGGQSKVRQQLGIQYKGFRYDEEWELYDIELDMAVNTEEGHLRLFPEGGMIMIRLKENIWRIAGNMTSILNYLPKHAKIGKVHWESRFRIHHKVAKSLSTDDIMLIGDAAHLHSPVGARGMNLGIEDAFMASQLLHENKCIDFTVRRRAYLENTVSRINTITMGFAGDSKSARLFRQQFGHLRIFFPLVMPRIRKFVMGLN